MAYSGGRIAMEDLLFNAKHNLIDQSMSSRSAETPTNGDGFGVGWYGTRERPGLFRSIRPAWNDFNFRDLAANIESHLFLAHVRATSLATVQETNCHPFRYNNWLFVHNGEIFEIEKMRRELLMAIAPEYFNNIMGTTDSEVMFHLALTFGLQHDPVQALSRMAGFIEKTGREKGVAESLWMTVAATDGNAIYSVRYASDRQSPTLYHSVDVDDVYEINPAIKGRFGDAAHMIVSEPLGVYPTMWKEVPESTMVIIKNRTLAAQPFHPVE
jgi:glutamine amidotransferase